MEHDDVLKARMITRRDFIKVVTAAAAALGLSELIPPGFAEAAAKPAVIWLHGQECTGCSVSVLAGLAGPCWDQPAPVDVILNAVEVKYHETIMAAAGDVAHGAMKDTIKKGGYVLVVEGSMPAADNRYLYVGGEPLEATFIDAANNAAAILAIGACATYGGINRPTPSKGRGVDYYLQKHGINKPLINLPGCPVRPEWFFGTVIYYITNNAVPKLDRFKRPLMYFGKTVHSECPRQSHYNEGRFLLDWNDPKQADYCLLYKGCKGIQAFSDCPNLLWNDGANWCIGANAPCAGCTEPAFYPGLSPLYGIRED